MSDKKKPEQKTDKEEIKSLRQDLDAITFKNDQVKKIKAIQADKERLKDSLATNRQRRVGAASRISGLGGLGALQTIQSKYKKK